MNYYSHHIGDFNNSTRHLPRLHRSILRDLLDLYYQTEQQLTLDIPKLKRKILADSSKESMALELMLDEFFLKTPSGWYNPRCEAEIAHYRANISQKALAGKASAAAKELKKQQALNGNSTVVEQTLNGALTNQNQNQNQKLKLKLNKDESKVFKADIIFELPDWINRNHWDVWHSSLKRKNATVEQKQLAIDQLARWKADDLDFASSLESAAVAGWQGLFKPKSVQIQSHGTYHNVNKYTAAGRAIFGDDEAESSNKNMGDVINA